MYNVHSRTFHANFIGFVLTLAYSRISALPFCLRYLFNANSFFASSSFVSFNRKMGLSIKGTNLLFLNKSKYGIFPRLIKTQHQLTMSDQNAYKFLTEMSNCLKIFHEKWQFLSISDQNITLFCQCLIKTGSCQFLVTMRNCYPMSDQNITLLIPGAAVMSASPSEKLYAGPLKINTNAEFLAPQRL